MDIMEGGRGRGFGYKSENCYIKLTKRGHPHHHPTPSGKSEPNFNFHDNLKILLLHCTITHIAMQEYFAKGDVIGLFTHFIFISEMNLN